MRKWNVDYNIIWLHGNKPLTQTPHPLKKKKQLQIHSTLWWIIGQTLTQKIWKFARRWKRKGLGPSLCILVTVRSGVLKFGTLLFHKNPTWRVKNSQILDGRGQVKLIWPGMTKQLYNTVIRVSVFILLFLLLFLIIFITRRTLEALCQALHMLPHQKMTRSG